VLDELRHRLNDLPAMSTARNNDTFPTLGGARRSIDKGRHIVLCFGATFRDEYFPGVGSLAPLYFKLVMI
jgi:hypothetical protein